MKKTTLFFYVFLTLIVMNSCSQSSENKKKNLRRGDRFEFTNIRAIPPVDDCYGGGYSFYSAAWRFFETPAEAEYFQTGLVSCWMEPQRTGNEPDDFYNTIEGGLGWWSDQRFPHKAPKFIMGGVSYGFYSWANGPGAGRADKVDGYRDWSALNGMLDVAQLSPNLLWAPDGLNIAKESNGELLGYGYLPLPLTDVMETTNSVDVTTGNQSWTLFLNAKNFKGPATFFLPTFWTKPTLEDPDLEGLFMDTRPTHPNSHWGIETAALPMFHSTDDNGNLYAHVQPVLYPASSADESVLLNKPVVYSKEVLWNSVEAWFNGGAVVQPGIKKEGQLDLKFDTDDENGVSNMSADMILVPGGETDEWDIDNSSYLQAFLKDNQSWGYKVDTSIARVNNGSFKTPEYFKLEDDFWKPVAKSEVPASTGLLTHEFAGPDESPLPYLSPIEEDCPWHDPNGPWMNPGPVVGPFQVEIADGSRLTYYWYRFIDQPAIANANLPEDQRTKLQERIELIHTHWPKEDEYLAPQSRGELASLDPGIIVEPPAGLEIGYVPIVTRQEKTGNNR